MAAFRWSTGAVTAFALMTYLAIFCHFGNAKRRTYGTLHKVTLSQSDVQFIEFDVDVPPLKEFTFCMWVRTLNDEFEQPLFSYSVDRYKEVEVWLEPGGGLVAVAIRGRTAWVPVRAQREWRHFCVSWHGAEGAWALYEDGSLVACIEDDAIVGTVLPKGGRITIGQGNPSRGSGSGIEADIFGFNMIIGSTINSALTIYDQPDYEQLEDHAVDSTTPAIAREKKPDSFYRKLYRYVVLDELTERAKKGKKKLNKTKKTKKNVTADLPMIPPYLMHLKNNSKAEHESEFVVLTSIDPNKEIPLKPQKNIFWNLVKKPGKPNLHFDAESTMHVLEYETPPPPEIMPLSFISDFETPPSVANDYFVENVNLKKKAMESPTPPLSLPSSVAPPPIKTLATIETPPPINEQPKVFGQWASISFTDSVLNSIKKYNINTRSPQKVVPKTIPLHQISDSFPYASELKPTIVVPPKNFYADRKPFPSRHRQLKKRDLNRGEKNVKLLNEEKSQLFSVVPMVSVASVEISSRGLSKDAGSNNLLTQTTERDYFTATNENSADSMSDFSNVYALDYSTFQLKPKPFQLQKSRLKNHNMHGNGSSVKTRTESDRYETAYAQMHFKGNMWHQPHLKRMFMPRMESNIGSATFTVKEPEPDAISTVDIRQLKYADQAKSTIKLSERVTNESPLQLKNEEMENENVIHIGGKPRRTIPVESKDDVWSGEADAVPVRLEGKKSQDTNEFKKTVKLGNALNEKRIFSLQGYSKEDSFIGSNKRVPDIDRYRSDLDGVNYGNVPPSLAGRKCRSRERKSKSRLKYYPDGSVGSQGLASAALRLIEASYKVCTKRKGSVMADSNISLVAWSKTPMRIFGGAEISFTEPPCYSIYVT